MRGRGGEEFGIARRNNDWMWHERRRLMIGAMRVWKVWYDFDQKDGGVLSTG